ncbi:MAG: hypothetical protein MJ118_08515, partial [Clostridia bacterium]|nr:hypothetical protein [Clostridia bacterium]
MKTRDIQPIIEKIRERVAAHKLAPGSYARYLWQSPDERREMGENPYGCADAANILYTINDFPRDREEREASVRVLQSMQGDDGLFHE